MAVARLVDFACGLRDTEIIWFVPGDVLGSEYIGPRNLTSALVEYDQGASRFDQFISGVYCVGGWVSLRAG